MTPSDLWVLAQAAAISLLMALASIAFGTLLAGLLTPLAFAPWRLLRAIYRLYIFVVRGTPVLLLALLVFYALASFWGRISPYAAGVVVLSFYLAALIAEVFRGGVLAIPRPLWDCCKSLRLAAAVDLAAGGQPAGGALCTAPLPQCLRDGGQGLLGPVDHQRLGTDVGLARDHRTHARRLSGPAVAALFYFIMCFAIDRLGRHLESRLAARGFAGERL